MLFNINPVTTKQRAGDKPETEGTCTRHCLIFFDFFGGGVVFKKTAFSHFRMLDFLKTMRTINQRKV